MLDLIRKYRNVFSAIFVVSALGLILTMFANPSTGSMSGGLSGGVVAKVEGHEIQTTELLQTLEREFQAAERSLSERAGNNPEMRKIMDQYLRAQITPDRILKQLIDRRFLMSSAEKAGIATPPEAIREQIQQMPAFQKDGRFDPLLYKQMVSQPALLEREIALESQYETFRSAFYAGLGLISPTEKAEHALISRERVFELLVVNPREFPEPSSVDTKDVQAFLASPDAPGRLQAYYERNIHRFRSEEQVRAKHILITEEAGGLKKAQELLADLQSRKSKFDAVAKAHSADKANASKGGDLGFFGRGTMDPAFEKAAFGLAKSGDLTPEPVKSAYGFHLIQLVDRKAPLSRTLEEVKAEIAPAVLLEQKRSERAQIWMTGWLSAGRAPSEADLKKLKLSWEKSSPWTPTQDRLGPISSVESRLGEILALGKGNALAKQPFIEGENLIAVRWVETKLGDKDDFAGAQLLAQKVEGAFQFYLQKRYEALEKNKKIIRSEKALSAIRNQLGGGLPQGS